MEFMKAGSSYAIVFGKKLQTFAAQTLGIEPTPVFAPNKEIAIEGQGLTAVERFSIAMRSASLRAKSCTPVQTFACRSISSARRIQLA